MEVKKDMMESLSDLKTGELKENENGSELFVFKDDNKGSLEVESEVVGAKPLPKPQGHISYGGALRAGEGDGIGQYVEQGKRIPRGGEVGVSGDGICGHWRINGVGIRKENQVCSGEDTRGLAMFNYEEKAKRKQKIMAHLQQMVQLQIGKAKGPCHDPSAQDIGEAKGPCHDPSAEDAHD